ncbi:MAG: hypothetical protein J6Q28_05340 [Alistipes sp.]|nr:hypothetical protein [Alistipes sp.]
MQIYRYILIALLVFVVGCTTPQHTLELINRSESVAEEHPDSSLLLIEQVNKRSVRGKQDKAHYRLVYSEALYHNQIDSDCDSLTRPLFDYYYNSNCHEERARAMYQHGLVMRNAQKSAEAMHALLEAEVSLQHCDNPRLLGLVHRTKGYIYGLDCLYDNALSEHIQAKDLFAKSQLYKHEVYGLYNIAQTLSLMRNYPEAIGYLSIAEAESAKLELNLLHYDILIELCYIYIQSNDYSACEEIYQRIDISENHGYSLCDYYLVGSVLEAHRGDFTKADKLFLQASHEDVTDKVRFDFIEIVIKTLNEDYKSALDLYSSAIEQQDKQILVALKQSVLNYEIDIVKRNINDVTMKNKRLTLRYIYTIIVVLLVLVFITIYICYHNIKHKREVISYINTISDLELLSRRTDNTDAIIKEIESLYQPNVRELNSLCEIFYENVDSDKFAKRIVLEVSQIINKLKDDDVKLDKLERIVNIYKGDVMSKLREQCYTLTDREIKIALYTFAGFSNRAISMLVECRAETLPKIKYKIRSKVSELCEEKDAEIMIQYLSQRNS